MKNLVDHAGLDDRLKVGRVDFEDAVEALHAQRNSAVGGNGATAQAGAGRCGRHGNQCFVCPAKHERDLFGSRRPNHHAGQHPDVFGFVVRKIRQAIGVYRYLVRTQ